MQHAPSFTLCDKMKRPLSRSLASWSSVTSVLMSCATAAPSPSRRALKAARGGAGKSSRARQRLPRVNLADQENQENAPLSKPTSPAPATRSAAQSPGWSAPAGWAAHRKPVVAASTRAALVALRRIEERQQSAAPQPEAGGKPKTVLSSSAATRAFSRAPITAFSPKPKRKLGSGRAISGACASSRQGGACQPPENASKRARR